MPILPRMRPACALLILTPVLMMSVGGCGVLRRADSLQGSIDRMEQTMSRELPRSNTNAEAMRADMKETSTTMTRHLEGMRIDLKDMSGELKKSLAAVQKDMSELRVSMTGEIGAMRTEMLGMREDLKSLNREMGSRLETTSKSITEMAAQFDVLHETVKRTEEGTLPRLQKIVENTNWMPAMAERTEDMKQRLQSMEGAIKSMESKTADLTDDLEDGLKAVLPAAGLVGAALVIGGFLAGRRRAA
ncbi:MAG: hypothetical protein HYY93_14130 [Planctomycetes bacterium]|nr:hypothetical protein [Planctomycetota bacterium]